MSSSGNAGGSGKKKPPTKHRSEADANRAEYDPADFIVPASDTKGHAARKTFRLSVSYAEEMSRVVSSKLFPFADESDLIRWAIREALRQLNEWEEIPNSVFGQAEAAMLVVREVLFNKQYEQMFQTMDEAMEQVRQQGGMAEIRRLYARVQSAFEKMPEGHWRTHYLSTLRRKYLHLIDPAANRARLAAEEGRREPMRLGMVVKDEEDTGS